MTVILFIVVLAVLVFAHELGHFLAAKQCGVRVSEFGIGFPPRLYAWKPAASETTYSINWIPFGGFVKLFKEDEDTGALPREEFEKTLDARPWWQRLWVLFAGVFFNVLLAWGLLSIGLFIGLPMSVDEDTRGVVGEPSVVAIHVEENTPAYEAGFIPGDVVLAVVDEEGEQSGSSIEDVQAFIAAHEGKELSFTVQRKDVEETLVAMPVARELDGETRAVVGIALDTVAVVRLPVWDALVTGGKTTLFALKAVAIGLGEFLFQAVTGRADFSQVAGPVGIAGLTGDAARLGLAALLSFAAMLSLNLAIINLVPFPALDGGRILFTFIEVVKGSPIRPSIANTMNFIGFALLILLMIAVTIHDILKLL
ncbi:MAG: hypothetical protein AMXMBFR44_3120 [Candidatus Campbellbacteria bacterium]